MAIINYRGVFPALNNSTRITIALPDINPKNGEKWPVLWLLGEEGMSSDQYVRKCDIESICRKYNIAVVMPEGLHSDYENMVRGLRWYDFVSDALPKYVYDIFPISDKKEDNYMFGFGMGGLGAFRLALRVPDMAVAFGCSNVDFDVFSRDEMHSTAEYIHKMETIYGDDYFADSVVINSDPYHMIYFAERIPRIAVIGNDESSEKIRVYISEKSDKANLTVIPKCSEYYAVIDAFLGVAVDINS